MSLRVLFVDDEPSIRLTFSAVLKGRGFEVVTCANVKEALAAISSERFDVLISDLNIGDPGDGFTVVSAMRRVQPQARTFIMTGFPDFDSALRAIRNQVDDYFIKPTDPETVIRQLERSLSAPASPLRMPLRRVSHILIDSTPEIAQAFLRRVQEHPELLAIELPDAERTAHVPEVIGELINRVRSGRENMSEAGRSAALRYGRARFEQGYTIPMLIAEARLLQRVITTMLQANLSRLDLSTLIPDLIHIGESFDAFLEIAVREFPAPVAPLTL